MRTGTRSTTISYAATTAQIYAAVASAVATAMTAQAAAATATAPAATTATVAVPAPPAAPAVTAAATMTTAATMTAAIKKFLIDVCSFSDAAATEITTNQGYDNLDELFLLDDKGIDNLCTIVRKPTTNTTGAVVPGVAIPSLAQERFKLSVFAIKHLKRVSREVKLDLITRKDVHELCQQRQMELSFVNKTDGYAIATFKDLSKTFEWVHEQLEHCRGVNGVPLAYVTRPDLIPKRDADDPAGRYPSLDAEMIACAPILDNRNEDPDQPKSAILALEEGGPYCATFRIDMVTCWNILYEMFGSTSAWIHGQVTKKEKNGRKLFRILFEHYLGADHVGHLATKMETRLATLTYRGEQKNWNWASYTDAHIEQHTIATNLKQYGYAGLDERSKVRHLLGGINDEGVNPVVCQVLALKESDKTFDSVAKLFAEYLRQKKHEPTARRLSSVGTPLGGGGGGRGRGRDPRRGSGGRGRGGDGRPSKGGGVPDQADVDKVKHLVAGKFYSTKEYATFNAAEKAWIHQNRPKPDKSPGKRKVAAVGKANESDDNKDLFESSGDESVTSAKSTRSNKGNSALARKSKRTK